MRYEPRVPFCRDCRHCVVVDDTRPAESSECRHPSVVIPGRVNIVTGEKLPDRYPSCQDEREVLPSKMPHCGYEGRNFESIGGRMSESSPPDVHRADAGLRSDKGTRR